MRRVVADADSSRYWFRSPTTWRFIALRHLPSLLVLNLPFAVGYTVFSEWLNTNVAKPGPTPDRRVAR